MLTWLARLLLVLTSMAPALIVYAAVLYEAGSQDESAIALVVATGLTLFCWALIKKAGQTTAADTRAIEQPQERDGDALAFLLTYALPLVAAGSDAPPTLWGLGAFSLVMLALVWQQQLFHINPLLGALGYYFFAAQADDGSRVLVLTKKKTIAGGNLPVVQLSEYLWLHCP